MPQQRDNELTLEREGLFQLLSSREDACAKHSFHMESGAFFECKYFKNSVL